MKLQEMDEEFEKQTSELKELMLTKLLTLTKGHVSAGVYDNLGAEVIAKDARFSKSVLEDIDYTSVELSNWTRDERINHLIQKLVLNYLRKRNTLDAQLKRRKTALTIGDELPSGIMQMAKVYIAKKRKISVGDKMAGAW